MGDETTQLLSADEAQKLAAFRNDLRAPHVVFGRCVLTGQWGKCVALDLGDMVFHAPNVEEGVRQDLETGKISFTQFDPVTFNNQALFSEAGLQMLLQYCQSQDNPIPTLTPDLVYQWKVLYSDGSGLCQFRSDGQDGVIEATGADIDFARVHQLSVSPRLLPEDVLPTYSFIKATGQFYKGSEPLDVGYEGPYVPDSEIVYCRKVAHTWASNMGTQLDRTISPVHTNVLQIMGWRVGGLPAVVDRQPTPGCLIAIDERGNWRPYDYSGE